MSTAQCPYSHVVHGIFKEDQVHDSVELIVGLEGVLQCVSEGVPGADWPVARLPNTTGKVAVDERLLPECLIIQILHECRYIHTVTVLHV